MQHLATSQSVRDMIARVSLLFRLERRVIGLIVSYALAIGLFSLIIPLTVQELVNTFAFSIQPIMIVTLAGIMVLTLLCVGAFRALQYYAVEILERRIFARVAIALTHLLPRLNVQGFRPRYANYFFETVLMQRALSVLLVDIINVVVGGIVGMTILVFYHPYFLVFNALLLTGFTLIVTVLSHGALKSTIEMSQAKYDTLHWLQEISFNLPHFKATVSDPLLLKRTDELVGQYVAARRTRFRILIRQYLGSVGWQALVHSALIGTAGWLLAIGQMTLGQLVAAEVIVGSLLINFDSVVKRLGYVFYFLTALTELDFVFSLPKDASSTTVSVPLPDPKIHGLRLTCKDLAFSFPDSGPEFSNFNLDVAPGEKIAIFSNTSGGKTALAKVLAGLYIPTFGVIRYNGVDIRDLNMESLNTYRGLILDSQLSLFEGTLEENITLDRPSISYEDIVWALRFVEMEAEVDAFPLGLKTPVRPEGKALTNTQIQKALVARAIVTRPQLLIFDGTLHSLHPSTREAILRRLCSKEEPWSVLFVSNDPGLTTHVDRRFILD
ncbi:MAG: ATP-binding cassette domain-containing protein [Nitrospirales bacterium]|nr:ATP-binding cassette domain-containing protein [Nitrospirales bacterium]